MLENRGGLWSTKRLVGLVALLVSCTRIGFGVGTPDVDRSPAPASIDASRPARDGSPAQDAGAMQDAQADGTQGTHPHGRCETALDLKLADAPLAIPIDPTGAVNDYGDCGGLPEIFIRLANDGRSYVFSCTGGGAIHFGIDPFGSCPPPSAAHLCEGGSFGSLGISKAIPYFYVMLCRAQPGATLHVELSP